MYVQVPSLPPELYKRPEFIEYIKMDFNVNFKYNFPHLNDIDCHLKNKVKK